MITPEEQVPSVVPPGTENILADRAPVAEEDYVQHKPAAVKIGIGGMRLG